MAEAQGEFCASAGGALDRDLRSVGLGDGLRDGEAETKPRAASTRGIATVEAVEDVGQGIGCDALTGVRNGEQGATVDGFG